MQLGCIFILHSCLSPMFSFEQKEDNFLGLHSLRFKYLWFSSFNNFRNTCRYLYSLFPNKLECSGETCAGGGGGLPAIQPVSNGGDRDTWWWRPGGAHYTCPVVLRAARVRARDTWTDGTRHARRQVPPPHMGPCARGASANTTTASGAARWPYPFSLSLSIAQVTSKRLRKKNAKNANLINVIRVHPCH